MTLNDLTNGTVDGNGSFDILMQAMSAHLKNEYKQKRITGSDYSKAYLGGVQAVLAQATQFALQSPLTTAQVALTDAQKLLVDIQIAEVAKRLEVGGLADQEVKRIIANTNQIDAQKLHVDQQVAELVKRLEIGGLADQQVLQATANVNQADAQTTLLGTQNTKTASENALVTSQIAKVDKEVLVLDKQILIVTEEVSTQLAKTQLLIDQTAKEVSSKALVDEQTASATLNRTDIMPAQLDKLLKEAMLLLYKTETEYAQTSDTLVDGVTPVAGTTGRQQNLLTEQRDSYKRNNEYKVAKMMMDNHSVHTNAGQAVSRIDAGTADKNIGTVMATVKSNVNL